MNMAVSPTKIKSSEKQTEKCNKNGDSYLKLSPFGQNPNYAYCSSALGP